MIDLTSQITQAQIALALILIAGFLAVLAFGKLEKQVKGKNTRPKN